MSPRRWLAGRTLRGRLIAGLVALLALACASVGLVSYLVLHQTLTTQLDAQLAAAGGRYVGCIEGQMDPQPPGDPDDGPPGQNCNDIPGLASGTFGARLKNGVVTNQGIVKGHSDLSAADKAVLARLPDDGRYFTENLASIGGDYRLTAIRGQDGDVIITGLPLANVESTLGSVELAELIAFSAALLLAGFIGTGFVRLSLRPLRRVAATARRVTELSLGSGDVTLSGCRTPIRGPKWARSGPRSTGCWSTSRRPWPGGPPARPGCAGSPRTPAMSCAPRWPPSGATPSWPAVIRAPSPPISSTPSPGSSRSRPG